MADVKYVVTVDSSGAVKSIDQLDKAWDKLAQTGKESTAGMTQATSATGGLWKQMAIGQLAAQVVQKAFRGLVTGIKESITMAGEEEASENRLKAALETTGRSIEGNLDAYKAFAAEKMRLTTHTHEEIEASETLLLQLTHLNQDGVKKAVEGAMGLSAVMGTDLQNATLMVTKAMEGNYTALQRVGIRVDESLGPQEKQAALLEKLGALYPRAEKELNTFGGQLKQLSNYWGEVKESVGGAITGNENVRKSMKDLSEGLQKMVESDRFKLWLSSLTDVIGAVVKGIAGITTAVINLEEKLFGAKGWEKYVADQQTANNMIQQGVDMHRLRRQAIDQEIVTTREWGEAYKKAGGTTKAMMESIVAGKQGPELRALFESMKKGAEDAAAAAKAAKPPINEIGNGISQAAKHAVELGKELKLTFADDIRSEIAKNEEALKLFGKALTPAGIEALKKKIAELQAQFKIGLTDQEKVDEIFKGLGLQTIPALAETTRVLELAMAKLNAQYKSGAIDYLTFKKGQEGINKELEANRVLIEQKLPPANTKLAKIIQDNYKHMIVYSGTFTKSAAEKFEEFAKKAQASMAKIKEYWGMVNSAMQGVFQQAQQNREIAIENEYKKRLAFINATVKNEDEKQKAITALEAEFEIKRTAAKAAAAKQSKAIAMMDAIVNTADAITKALTAGPFIGPILAGIIGAMGAIQIALIAKQPIPLARGAVFKKPTIMSTTEGATFEVGEAGTEYLIPEKHLAPLLGGGLPGMRPAYAGAGRRTTININSPLIQGVGLSDAILETAGAKLYEIIRREARRHGGL